MQPCLRNADYLVYYLCNYIIMQQSSIKRDYVIEKSCGPLKCLGLQRLLMIT